MTIHDVPRFLVVDDFLAPELAAGLLEHALKRSDSFRPAEVMRDGDSRIATDARISMQCDEGLGPYKAAFTAAVHERKESFVEKLGIPNFPLAYTELQLIAHGDGAFYKAHIDTHTVDRRSHELTSDRVVSLVYYFHRAPKNFSGGEIAIHPFCKIGSPAVLEPRQNRLVVFPSFAWHEVRRISCLSGDFGDSRFAINCWLHRERTQRPGR